MSALADFMAAARETLASVEFEAPAEETEPPSPARGPRIRRILMHDGVIRLCHARA